MPSQRVVDLCTSAQTVTEAFAKSPHESVNRVRKRVLPRRLPKVIPALERTEDALNRAEQCGKFPKRPSDLFLKVYNDALATLDRDTLANMVSPSLFGSSGVIPLSIVSVIPDIMRHYAELIVSAKSEVFLATNYWEPSLSSTIISDSIRELSKRVRSRGGQPVVFKLMYDRGSLHQLVNNHVKVPPSMWPKVNIPRPEEIPGVTLEVVNYHRPPLGTFHAKYLVVDRRVACINSNNIQDRPNVEMMVHLEGPIVNSFYDVALLSWFNVMKPPLPLLGNPPTFPETYKFNHDNELLKYIDQEATSKATREFLKKQHTLDLAQATEVFTAAQKWRALALHNNHPSGHDLRQHQSPQQNGEVMSDAESKSVKLLAEHPNMMVPHQSRHSVSRNAEGEPEAAQKQQNYAQNGHARDGPAAEAASDTSADDDGHIPPIKQNGNAESEQTKPSKGDAQSSSPPSVNLGDSDTLSPPSESAAGGDSQPPLKPGAPGSTVRAKDVTAADIAKRLNIGKFELDATVADEGMSDFKPYILHTPHSPCPIAMVNRRPTGAPGHRLNNPQDKAWLSALRNAQKSVFIQTPTFNAAPLIPATLDACRRGVEVTLYLDLGFNDQGEQIPFQGGTNEMVVNRMYTRLNAEEKGHAKNLRVYWYTGKDQKRPISAAAKKRNCHIKFMAVDDQIAIFGNGNQDTQSWFHSMEINVMVDSPALVRDWLSGIDANQNTRLFGRVSDVDGIWRDGDEVLQASGIKAPNIFTWLSSVSNQIKRLFAGKF